MKRPPIKRQRGVAVITALLLTTLAVTIVASLFWQQQVQVRSMENQRLQLQTKWILRGALDWSRLILRQDGFDHRDWTSPLDVWATPLAETRLDDYVERERVEGEQFDATLSGQMTDAQARYNLTNLATARTINQPQLEVFRRLLVSLQLDPALAQSAAEQVARSQSQGTTPGIAVTSGSEPMALLRAEDLLAVAGFAPQALERLRDFVIVLPVQTMVNINSAPAEVLAALVENFSVSEASVLVNNRKIFKNVADFTALLGGRKLANGVQVDVKSSYFLALSRVRLDRASLDTQALIARDSNRAWQTSVIWIREQ